MQCSWGAPSASSVACRPVCDGDVVGLAGLPTFQGVGARELDFVGGEFFCEVCACPDIFGSASFIVYQIIC